MVEIWLAPSIAFELVRAVWPFIALGLGLWLVLLWMARRRLGRHAIAPVLAAGVAVALLAFPLASLLRRPA